ncbi:MAG: bifunctional nicotinamidase/pyrazinamidase [Hyphomicrobiaceae bacterium]|nr:bifunctional nicotinamidase/pyrazinamidase [Hyphomicrobiaceae bacterium]
MPDPASVLLVVDVQNDFCPGGALPVPSGHEVLPVINALVGRFDNVLLTQDWHPVGHISFASSHAERKPFETVTLAYGPQVLWPDHCVQATPGAAFHADLRVPHAQAIVRKGYRAGVDSYSGFIEADRVTPTGLGGYLAARGLKRIYVVGLATDFCVAWTALDARGLGLEAIVIEDACRGIDAPTVPGGTLAAAWADMAAAGVVRLRSDQL